jgi:Protein of unknown function (DUF1800)
MACHPVAVSSPHQLCLFGRGMDRLATVVLCLFVLAGCGGGRGPTADSAANPSAEPATAQALSKSSGAGEVQRALLISAREAVQLADSASFGPTEALINTIRTQGAEAWIADQLATTGSVYTSGGGDGIHSQVTDNFCGNAGPTCYRDHYTTDPLVWDFHRNAVARPDQLRQRVAFALSQIFVISSLEVSGTYGFREYHNSLLDNAFGNYRDILRKVTLSPLMGDYLGHVNNDKTSPNENYARELLQLFAVGTCRLNADGSLESERCVPVYDNRIVRDYAFALTGWTYPAGGNSQYGCYPEFTHCRYYNGDMAAQPALADDQARTLLSNVSLPATRTPQQALERVLDSLMAEPSMAPFVARQMIQQLTKSNPSPSYIRRVSTAFTTGRFNGPTRSFGSGVKGDMTALLTAVLLDAEARNPDRRLAAEKLREPVLMMLGVIRALNGKTDGAVLAGWWGFNMRQQVFRAPSVFNYFSPNYPVIGTNLVGPAFGIYNVNTALARLNFLNHMIVSNGAEVDDSIPGGLGSSVDLSAFEADADRPLVLLERLSTLATGGRLSGEAKGEILPAILAFDATVTNDWRAERVRTAAYLVFASPAYQVLN